MARFRVAAPVRAVSVAVFFFSAVAFAWPRQMLAGDERPDSPRSAYASASESARSKADSSDGRTAAVLRAAVRKALKAASSAKGEEKDQAARTLVTLYKELKADANLNATERAALGASVRYRLAQLSKQIQAQLARDKKLASHGKLVGTAPKAAPPTAEEIVAQIPVAAQQFPFLQQQPGRAGAVGANAFQAGQPQAPFQQPRFGPPVLPPVEDYGQDLVKLIEDTISPDTWAVHGGQGTIFYFQPFHALVVNQTAESHDQLGGLLRQLQK